jgi:glycosyltransferase involved in cell wall biosynthesis
VRVHVVDPSAYTPPYDHALCRALAAAGARVDLYTSRFSHGEVPAADGYRRHETFYRALSVDSGSRARRALKLIQHVPDMLRYRTAARAADVVHFQWLAVQPLDLHLLPSGRPLVLTAHDVLPREPRPGQLAAQRRLYERVDAVVVHSAHGQRRLVADLGVDFARVHLIPHGVLRPWEDREPQPLPGELQGVEGPVVLFFGLLRPYKGVDVLLEAWRGIGGAELWIVGAPRMDIAPLRAAAPAGVRWLTRFVSDQEALAFMRRASLVVLPYREIDQSGVAFTALGSGVPLLLSDVGGFPELAATGAARTFPGDDAHALREALRDLLDRPDALETMAQRALAAAEGPYSWRAIAGQTLALYERLLAR